MLPFSYLTDLPKDFVPVVPVLWTPKLSPLKRHASLFTLFKM